MFVCIAAAHAARTCTLDVCWFMLRPSDVFVHFHHYIFLYQDRAQYGHLGHSHIPSLRPLSLSSRRYICGIGIPSLRSYNQPHSLTNPPPISPPRARVRRFFPLLPCTLLRVFLIVEHTRVDVAVVCLDSGRASECHTIGQTRRSDAVDRKRRGHCKYS
ncbi:hypothetical protein GY45DRAFT_360705 [Cubamyces sp. BRFM 1775]|nr:hypothetical protein GY45DRAFT_360705 [Cubamyces sp. BRFM 1775]